MPRSLKWYRSHRLGLEVFVFLNLAGLAPDIYLAHSTNAFREWTEYVPLVYSLIAPWLLLAAIAALQFGDKPAIWRWLGSLVGWASVLVGLTGLILHLDSRFFQEHTLDSLVYAAPFAAPLAYTGIGLLLIMNRLVDHESAEWPGWVLLLALIGFGGNFVFSVTDHAQNGFYHWTEWIPVVSSALAVGFLAVPLLIAVGRPYLALCAVVLVIQAIVGVLGFYFHFAADLHGTSPNFVDNLVYGAPVLAPLLFPNLVVLSFLGLRVLDSRLFRMPAFSATADRYSEEAV